jgi:tRNA/tmRNA/rRNA uracil-C5-methylase (TrmA/RlmC/RlmD family)
MISNNDKKKDKLSVGDIITLDIGPIAHGGHFIARYNNQVIFVRHAITDEIANVKITSITSKLAFGDALEILQSSKYRTKPPCGYSKPGGCGGCDFQHISIEKQQDFKKLIIQDQFKRIAQININPDILSTEPSSGLHWRSRLDLAVSANGKTGLYAHKAKDIIEIDECLIAVDEINNSEVFKQHWAGEDRLSLSVSSDKILTLNRLGKIILGSDNLKEIAEGNIYNISPNSFWQSHINAPNLLVQKVMKYADIKLGDNVCDLYGGVGLFTAPMVKLTGEAGQVHLIERNNDCIKDARQMFQHQKNIIIHHGKVEQKLGRIKNIDIIILDPPSNGAGKQVIKQIIDKQPRSIIYISCDPASLARDTKILTDDVYSLETLIGIDLFPMTHHIECIASFKIKI